MQRLDVGWLCPDFGSLEKVYLQILFWETLIFYLLFCLIPYCLLESIAPKNFLFNVPFQEVFQDVEMWGGWWGLQSLILLPALLPLIYFMNSCSAGNHGDEGGKTDKLRLIFILRFTLKTIEMLTKYDVSRENHKICSCTANNWLCTLNFHVAPS